MKRWIVALFILLLASCSSLDQQNSNLSYDEAEKLINDSPLLSTTATLSYGFDATIETGANAGTELKGEIRAQASDYPESDYLPAFTVFEGQLGLADGSQLEASGLILNDLVYVFFIDQENNTVIRGRGLSAEDGSIKGSFLALISGEWNQGSWQATPPNGTPTPEDPADPEDPAEPAPEPEEPSDPAPEPEEPEEPAPDPENPEEPGAPEPEEPEEPAQPTPEDPIEPEEPEEPEEEPAQPGGDLPAPPETLVDRTLGGNREATRVFYDDEIAIYAGEGIDTDLAWMREYVRDVWRYTKETYGSFGDDPRLYVFAHGGNERSAATIGTYFDGEDSNLGGRNGLSLGGTWNWEEPAANNYEVITHEISHIVEFAANGAYTSPTFKFWGDSKWAEIFMYDVYKALDKDDWAQDWFERMQDSTGGYADAYAFRDWYYPIYEEGGAETYDGYFKLLNECFPQSDVFKNWYERDLNPGEVLHFFSGAAGKDLSERFDKAFGLTPEVQDQLEQAQSEMTCANTY